MAKNNTLIEARPAASSEISRSSVPADRFTDNYLPFLLAQASAMVCSGFAKPLRDAKLSNAAWRILASLNDEGELTVGQLSIVVLTIQPRVTQAIAELEADGLVRRRRDTVDKRRTLVRITENGEDRVRGMLGSAKECERTVTTGLSDADVAQLKLLLRQLLLKPPTLTNYAPPDLASARADRQRQPNSRST